MLTTQTKMIFILAPQKNIKTDLLSSVVVKEQFRRKRSRCSYDTLGVSIENLIYIVSRVPCEVFHMYSICVRMYALFKLTAW